MKPSSAPLKYEVENPIGMRVYAYRNLHKNCFSLMDTRGRVIKHVPAVYLTDVEFRVRKSGYEKVKRTGQRNVHAFAIGTVEAIDNFKVYNGQEVRYNPKSEKPYFQNIGGHPVYRAKNAVLAIIDGTRGKVFIEAIIQVL